MPSRELVIRIQMPRWTARRGALVALSILLVASGVVYANVAWTPFTQGEKLSSAKMNTNLKALADAIDAKTLQPHYVLNKGNVDLGVYMGTFADLPLVYSPTVGGPVWLGATPLALRFTGPNCTGTAYPETGSVPLQYILNVAYDTYAGRLFRAVGPRRLDTAVSENVGIGCKPWGPGQINAYPLEDTKVPSFPTGADLLDSRIELK